MAPVRAQCSAAVPVGTGSRRGRSRVAASLAGHEREGKIAGTGKYDRKAIKCVARRAGSPAFVRHRSLLPAPRARLDLEEFVDAQLAILFEVADSADVPVELDLDELAAEDEDKRAPMLQV